MTSGPSTDASSDSVKEEPTVSLRGLGRHTLIYGLGILLSKAVSFLMLPIYTRFLTPADYGVMELIEMTLDVIAITAGAKIAIGIFRFYHKAETQEERNSTVSTALLILAMSYGTVATLTFIAAPFLSDLVFESQAEVVLIRLAAASMGFQCLVVAPVAYLRVRQRSTLLVVSQLVKLVIQLILNIVLVVGMRLGVQGVFISSLSANVLVGTVLAIYTVRQVGLRYSPAATKDLLRYGTPLIATQIATFLATFGDRYFLKVWGDVTEVGIYGLAYKFGFLLYLAGYMPVSSIWEPTRFSVAKRDDRDATFARVFILVNVGGLFIFTGLVLFSGEVIRIMADPSYHEASRYVPPILIAYMFQVWTDFQDLGIHVRERTELITLANWICAIVAVLAYWALVPTWLSWGAAWGTALAFFIRWVLVYTMSQRLWVVRYEWGPVLRLVALSGAAGFAGQIVPDALPIAARLGLRTFILMVWTGTVWYSGIIDLDARRAIVATARGLAERVRAGRTPH